MRVHVYLIKEKHFYVTAKVFDNSTNKTQNIPPPFEERFDRSQRLQDKLTGDETSSVSCLTDRMYIIHDAQLIT